MIPKGTLVHEATRLPQLWWRALISPLPKAKASKMTYGEHPRQYYLFCPAQQQSPAPEKWIIYFHGGSWRWGKPDLFLSHARQFTDLGFNVILPSYRPCPKSNYKDIYHDLSALLKRLHENHPTWSPATTVTGGMSAGGHLAALLALDHSISKADIYSPEIFKGFFALGAPLDLNQMPDSFAIRDLTGPKGGALFQKANPSRHLPLSPSQQALVIHGELDGMVPVSVSASFVHQAEKETPHQIEFHPIHRGTHLSVAAWPFQRKQVYQLLTDWLKSQAGHTPVQ